MPRQNKKFNNPHADSNHKWYPNWIYQRRHPKCPWETFKQFKTWAEERGYDPKAGDKILVFHHRVHGWMAKISRPSLGLHPRAAQTVRTKFQKLAHFWIDSGNVEETLAAVRRVIESHPGNLFRKDIRGISKAASLMQWDNYSEYSGEPAYPFWRDMIKDCYSKRALAAMVVESWHNYHRFSEWATPKLDLLSSDEIAGMELYRYNDREPYGPENCAFI